jgi:hypothetical protein
MKNNIRIALLSLSLGAISQAAPFMAVGDGAELFLTGTLGVRVDDNILLGSGRPASPGVAASPEVDDVIFDINPGVELTFGKDAQVQGLLDLSIDFANYSDNSDLNTELFQGDFSTRFDDGKMKLNFDLGYHELNQNTVDTRGLIRRDVFTVGGGTEIVISPITSVGAEVKFASEDYKRTDYSDSEDLMVPINLYYKWTPKVDLSAGYRYRDQQVDGTADSQDHFFSIGARGEFSPKLTGKIAVGLNTRERDGGGDDSLFGLDASMAYEISPKTSFEFGASNDFDTSPQGVQQENFTLNGLLTTKLSEEWSVNGGLSYRQIDYDSFVVRPAVGTTPALITPSRSDDYWEATLGTSYAVNANVKIVGSYVYRKYDTDLAGSEFKNNVFSIAANFRY